MIKLCANLSKKVPIPGLDFSSQHFGASLEIEVSDADKADAIQARIRELYGLLGHAIDEQIAAASGQGYAGEPVPEAPIGQYPSPQASVLPPPQQQYPAPALVPGRRPQNGNGRNRTSNGNGNGNGRPTQATDAQRRAIFAICKTQNLDMAAVLAQYGVADAAQLTLKSASELIDSLKRQRQGNGAHA